MCQPVCGAEPLRRARRWYQSRLISGPNITTQNQYSANDIGSPRAASHVPNCCSGANARPEICGDEPTAGFHTESTSDGPDVWYTHGAARINRPNSSIGNQ